MSLPEDAVLLGEGGLPPDAVPLQSTKPAVVPGWGSRVARSVGDILDLSKYGGRAVGALGGGETAQAVGTGLAAIPAALVAGASVPPTAVGEALRPVGEAVGRNLPAPGLQAGSEALDPAQFGAERMGIPSPEGRAAAGEAVGEFATLGGSLGVAGSLARAGSTLFRKLLNTGISGQARNQAVQEIFSQISSAIHNMPPIPSKQLFDVLKTFPGKVPIALPTTERTLTRLAAEEIAGSGLRAGGIPTLEGFEATGVPQLTRPPWPGVHKGTLTEPRTPYPTIQKTYDLTEAYGPIPLQFQSKELIEYAQGLHKQITSSPDLHVGLDTLRSVVSQLGERIGDASTSDRLRGAYRAIYRSIWDDFREGAARTGNQELRAYADAMGAYHTEQTAQTLGDFLQRNAFGTPNAQGLAIGNPAKALSKLRNPVTAADKELVKDLKQIGAYDGTTAELQRAQKYATLGKPKIGLPGQLQSATITAASGLGAAALGASGGTSVVTAALAAPLYHGAARLLMTAPGRRMVQQAVEGGGGVISQRAALAASLAGRTSLHRAFEVPIRMQPTLAETNYRKPNQQPPDSVVLDLSKPITGVR